MNIFSLWFHINIKKITLNINKNLSDNAADIKSEKKNFTEIFYTARSSANIT